MVCVKSVTLTKEFHESDVPPPIFTQEIIEFIKSDITLYKLIEAKVRHSLARFPTQREAAEHLGISERSISHYAKKLREQESLNYLGFAEAPLRKPRKKKK